jgi:hypothetical protein
MFAPQKGTRSLLQVGHITLARSHTGLFWGEEAALTAHERHSIKFCRGLPLLQTEQAADVQRDWFGWDHLKRLAAKS